jgi:four helix bundle protein
MQGIQSRTGFESLNVKYLEVLKIVRFEDILAWQKAKVHTVEIYKLFEKSKDFAFRDQIQRASVSVMNNIAEGFERKSNKEFIYFYLLQKVHVDKLRSMLDFSPRIKKNQKEHTAPLQVLAEEISRRFQD